MCKIIGIDLGTSTSEAAVYQDGEVILIPNHLGEYITPSCVHIRKDGTAIVGREAKELLLLEPECTFYEVKRLFGGAQTLRAHGRNYAPEEIQSHIIAYLVRCASDFLGYGVTNAVITVPAYFSDIQRKQTVQAGELAGVTVSRIINEPTAAALDYGLSNLSECKQLLVYDLGGGTLDVTVLELFEGVLDVKSTCGNNKLGGKDFDEAIAEHLTGGKKPDIRSVIRIKTEAEACKIALSEADAYHIALPFLQTNKGKPFSVDQTVTRETLEELIGNSVRSTQAQINTALLDARLSPSDIDEVLLVGGSTRIPLVAEFLSSLFLKPPRALVNPDLAVARGAAAQAAIIAGDLSGKLAITDICPFTLGTSCYDIVLDRLVFHPLIKRNSVIPITKTDTFRTIADGQTKVKFRVYQGEYSNPDNNQSLGEMLLEGVPPAPAGDEPIECTFAYDVNGILQVSAKVVSTQREISVKISTTGIEEITKIDLDGWQSKPGAKQYRPAIKKAEKLAKSGSLFKDELTVLVTQLKEAIVLDNDCEELYAELMELLEAHR
jgi:molecular chaperone DnaK